MIEDLFWGVREFRRFTFQALPVEEWRVEQLLFLVQLVKVDPERALELFLPTHDDPKGILIAWQGESYKVVLGFPMEDFGWPNPLLLCGEGLAFEDVREIMRGILLEGRDTESIPVIMDRFRDVTSKAFGDFPADD